MSAIFALFLVAPAASGGGTEPPDDTGGMNDGEAAAAWEAVVEAAGEEGQAVVYVSETPAWIETTAALFEETTGLELVLGQRGGSGTLEERLTAEMSAEAPVADLLSVIDKNYFSDNADWWVDLSSAGMPNLPTYPEESVWQDLCVENKQTVAGILYNHDLVPEDQVPTSWEDVVDPYWQGKTVMVDPRASDGYMGWAVQMQLTYGDEFLEGIATLDPDLQESSVPSAELVASGAYEITYLSPLDASSDLRGSGAPVTHVIPEGPGIGNTACAGILKDGPNPNAALVLLNFLMSQEAQSAVCEAGVQIRSPIDAPGCLEVPEGWSGTPIDPETGRIFGTGDEEATQNVLELLGIS